MTKKKYNMVYTVNNDALTQVELGLSIVEINIVKVDQHCKS